MRASILKLSILMLAVAVVAPVLSFGQEVEPVTTTRDAQGVWFIEGGTLYDVYEAMGYAVATDRLFQMELYRRNARGTLSELFGANFLGSDFLSGDIFIRNVMYSDDEYDEMFDDLSDDARTAIQAYVDGINRLISEFYAGNWMAMPHEYWMASFLSVFQLGGGSILPTPWTTTDVLAWMALLQRNFDPEAFETGQLDNYVLFQTLAAVYPTQYLAMFQDLRWLNDPSAQTMIPPAMTKRAYVAAPEVPTLKADAFPDLSDAANRIRSTVENRNESLEKINARVKMGSYAWVVSGDKTASGDPIIYSGPQMGFPTPSIVTEGSIRGGGLNISGMTVPGVPGIIIGRTPHHAWSMQVGHAHTQDWFLEAPQSVFLHRYETFYPVGSDPVTVPIYRSFHGPILEPFPYDPDDPPPVIVSMAYAHWGLEAQTIESFLDLARAESIAEFDAGIEMIAVSQHFCYADRDGNIAYWMSGYDPIRAPGVDPRFPQIGDGTQEWTGARRPRVHDENTPQGYYGGWNNKASVDYMNAPQSAYYGPAHRAHVIDEYLSTHDNLTYEEVRDLALNIATTDGIMGGGNSWSFVADAFKAVVAANSSPDRDAAIDMLDAWDGHFVAGGPAEWRFGDLRADAWALQDYWIREVLRITFEDEFRAAGMNWESQSSSILFDVLLHALAGQTFYDWFQDAAGTGDKPVGAEAIILRALDNVIETAGLGPYNLPRGSIVFGHALLAQLDPAFGALHSMPYSDRSTYAHCVQFDSNGPARIESMFPLGESGALYFNGTFVPTFDPNFFSMAPFYDPFLPRNFPLFD
jgi:penicillin amidase